MIPGMFWADHPMLLVLLVQVPLWGFYALAAAKGRGAGRW